ncbi:hypothetical protein myaer87_13050 [Microcystis aeruginosa NIES-87]|nr:hypothetical protein myaer87_13050 [Microcystis aeruginosa NIES-87]
MLIKLFRIGNVPLLNQKRYMLDNLIDEIGENENNPLASLMEILGILIKNYEQENVPEL